MAAANVVYSRDTSSVQPDYAALKAAGVTVALNASDPNLAAQIERARQNGMEPAIWIPATPPGVDPVAYGKYMAALVQTYKPSSIIPNIEFAGKGGQGSDGWNWNQAMMAEYAKYVPAGKGPPLSVAVMPNQDDFNYEVYLAYGGNVQVEAFGADIARDQVNVDELVARLRQRGIPEDKIQILLAPGQDPGSWRGALAGYTLDDMTKEQLATYQAQATASSTSSAGATTTGSGDADYDKLLHDWMDKVLRGEDPGPPPPHQDRALASTVAPPEQPETSLEQEAHTILARKPQLGDIGKLMPKPSTSGITMTPQKTAAQKAITASVRAPATLQRPPVAGPKQAVTQGPNTQFAPAQHPLGQNIIDDPRREIEVPTTLRRPTTTYALRNQASRNIYAI